MQAVIMTGGRGIRMAPYTKVLPKGLLPVGEHPILDIIVRQLKNYGFTEIVMACGYLAPLIELYFQQGQRYGVNIRYFVEPEPRGTAGALRDIPDLESDFLVMNCDVLTTFDFAQFYERHLAGAQELTVASQFLRQNISFGVLDVDGDVVIDLREKPLSVHRVSMGVYMLSKPVLEVIPENTFFDIPDVIRALLTAGRPVAHFENKGEWVDIGTPADYERANFIFDAKRDRFLGGAQE